MEQQKFSNTERSISKESVPPYNTCYFVPVDSFWHGVNQSVVRISGGNINSQSHQEMAAMLMRGRYSYVEFNGEILKICKRSFTHLVQFVHPQSTNTAQFTAFVSYADDCTVLTSNPTVDTLCNQLSYYLNVVRNWFDSKRFSLSTEKSTVTFFTSWTKEVNLQLSVNINSYTVYQQYQT